MSPRKPGEFAEIALLLPANDTSIELPTSRCVSPSCAARVRSTSTVSAGAAVIWCTWTSTTPGTGVRSGRP